MQNLNLENISKKFGDLTVIENVTITIPKGKFAAIVGPSGCGKSTLLRMLAGLETATTGEVLANNDRVTAPSPQRMMIFQEHALYPWRTVEENVGFGLELEGVRAKERKNKVNEILEKVGLAGFATYYPSQLSGGMKQRASIARALVMQPEVLLLDEPYGALDAITRVTMQNELVKLWKGSGMTVLLITHDIDEAVYLADTIYVMSPRPARIVKTLHTEQERPRNRNSNEFITLREEIMNALDIGVYSK
jgi:ABC-type nitrate/sulfonate/bicarbonate transport system ATPase subunit